MLSILKNFEFSMALRLVFYTLFALVLTACGGGGGSPGITSGGGGGVTPNGSIKLVLTDTTGATANTVTGANSLVVKATVTTGNGAPARNVLVTFEVSSTLAVLSTSTALTDSNGVAQISLKSAGTGTGAAEITAKAIASGTTEISAKMAFAIGASPTAVPVAINFVSAVPNDASIVIKGSGGNGRTEVALLTFKVVDNAGSGVPNVKVNFSTQSLHPVTLVSASAISDSNGSVTVALNSGTLPTTVRVIATVDGTTISTISGIVDVTTGQPVQARFSISAEKWYVEGANIDNVTNKIIMLLADQFGGAVADGTQIVFTTDGGAIVGDGGARCLTIKGECSVTWRSQNPRTASGVVTVTATATSGTTNLAATRSFYSSGSRGFVTLVSTNATQNPDRSIAVDFGTSCAPVTLSLSISDANNNPMPETTAISAVNSSKGAITIAPDKVSYDGRNIVGGAGGSLHDVTITPANCDTAGTGTPETGSFSLSVKSPSAAETLTRVTFNFAAKPN